MVHALDHAHAHMVYSIALVLPLDPNRLLSMFDKLENGSNLHYNNLHAATCHQLQ